MEKLNQVTVTKLMTTTLASPTSAASNSDNLQTALTDQTSAPLLFGFGEVHLWLMSSRLDVEHITPLQLYEEAKSFDSKLQGSSSRSPQDPEKVPDLGECSKGEGQQEVRSRSQSCLTGGVILAEGGLDPALGVLSCIEGTTDFDWNLRLSSTHYRWLTCILLYWCWDGLKIDEV